MPWIKALRRAAAAGACGLALLSGLALAHMLGATGAGGTADVTV